MEFNLNIVGTEKDIYGRVIGLVADTGFVLKQLDPNGNTIPFSEEFLQTIFKQGDS